MKKKFIASLLAINLIFSSNAGGVFADNYEDVLQSSESVQIEESYESSDSSELVQEENTAAVSQENSEENSEEISEDFSEANSEESTEAIVEEASEAILQESAPAMDSNVSFSVNAPAIDTQNANVQALMDQYGDLTVNWNAVQENGTVIEDAKPFRDPFQAAGGTYAKAYTFESSKDGITFEPMLTFVRVDSNETQTDGTRKWVIYNPLSFKLYGFEQNSTYHIRLTAYKTTTISAANKISVLSTFSFITPAVKQLAFPGAEGGGKYARGGRGGDVYVVTTLDDDASDPIPGSLRYGLKRLDKDPTGAASKDPRTIVFAVGGNIKLQNKKTPTARASIDINDNTTIAGQTAPGQGITISNWDSKIKGDNIIVRYIRFRESEEYNYDSLTVSETRNLMVDHCTVGNGVDEAFSIKGVLNSTFQWCILSEPYAMPSGANESEIQHGFGGIWQGFNTTWHHNLIANSLNRNPKFQGGDFVFDYNKFDNKLDYANNVVYNWAYQPGHGGDGGYGLINFVNNYYKPGPDTYKKRIDKFYQIDGSTSKYYIDGNIMEGSADVTADNTKGFLNYSSNYKLSSKADLVIKYDAEPAAAAYENVLNGSGATLPKRDAYDARVISEVRNGNGYIISSAKEMGGFPTDEDEFYIDDTDEDGIPDEYEYDMSLDAEDPSDANKLASNGYTNLENYLNTIVDELTPNSVTNPTVSLNVNLQDHFTVGEVHEITANVAPNGDEDRTIDIVHLYENDVIVDSSEDGVFSYMPEAEGTYTLLARAYDSEGYSTFSAPVQINVDYPSIDSLISYKSIDIGNPSYAGVTTFEEGSDKIIMKGAGYVGGTSDKFYFNYLPVYDNAEVSVKVEDLKKIYYGVKAGIMLREDLTPTSRNVFLTTTYKKLEGISKDSLGATANNARVATVISRTTVGGSMPKAEDSSPFWASAPKITTDTSGCYLKLKKTGDKVECFVSSNGIDWTILTTVTLSNLKSKCYLGLAVDSDQMIGDSEFALQTYNRAVFSNLMYDTNFIPGDVDGNGEVDGKDIAGAMNVLIEGEASVSSKSYDAADFDGDGKVTINDVIAFMQSYLDGSFFLR